MPETGSSGPTAEDEQRYRRLVDANVIGVTISDDDRVLESNDAWLNIVGRTREELEAGEISWRAITAPEWAAQDDQVTRKLDDEGWVAPYEKEYIRPDGTRVPVLLSGVTLDRDPLRVVAVVIDLSERRAHDRERELLLSREREARREAELAADRSARLQRVTAALSAASSADEVGEVVVGQAVDDFYAAAGALAFRDRRRGPDAPRPRLRGDGDGGVAALPAPHRRAGLRRAAHRRAGVPGDARRLGALPACCATSSPAPSRRWW